MNEWQTLQHMMAAAIPWQAQPFASVAAVVQTKAPEVTFVYPRHTTAVRCSETCALNCAHCGGVYLQGMQAYEPEIDAASLLVSGGCDPAGRVPFGDYLPQLRRWRDQGGRRLNFHVGLIPDRDIPQLQNLADTISFDFVYHQETIREVFGLDVPPQQYLDTFRQLRQVTKVIPHICVGLKGGSLVGERAALEVLQAEKIDALAFIVFIPTPGTTYADRQPPPLAEVIELLAEARIMFPGVSLHLGCMRPKGRYRMDLDAAALALGWDKIVQPTPLARQSAEESGLTIWLEEECCSL